MDIQTSQAINAVSKRVNDLASKIDDFANMLHNESTDSIDTTDGGVTELAALVADLIERVTILEEKVGE